MKMKSKILVTGGAGYIGSHTCKALSRAGYRPVVYDNLCNGHEDFVQWGDLIRGDLNDIETLEKAIETHSPSAIMHFAAFAYVGESVDDPLKYYANNVAGTLSLLKAMQKNSVSTIIFSSTCALYGIPDEVPISEHEKKRPINPYGKSKLMIEDILEDCGRAYGLKHVSLRYFNAAGADPDLDVGEDHYPETHLVPRVIMAATGAIDELAVYGNDYDTHDGTCIRDYIHVSDLAGAHVNALKYLEAGGPSEAFNLGTGCGASVAEIIQCVDRIAGRKTRYRIDARRPGDPAVLIANYSRARQTLGWEPRNSTVENIIETAWKWHHKRFPRAGVVPR